MERVYVVPLKKAFKKPRTKRADAAISIVREFVSRHMGVEVVKIGKELNEHIWSRGRKKIPRRVRIKVVTEEKEGKKVGKVELVGFEYKELKVQAPKITEETKKKLEERLGPKALEKQKEDEMIEKGEKPEEEKQEQKPEEGKGPAGENNEEKAEQEEQKPIPEAKQELKEGEETHEEGEEKTEQGENNTENKNQ